MTTAPSLSNAMALVSRPPARPARRRIGVLPLVLGLPVLAWQLVFFAGALAFLVAVTFWQVRSFRLEPAMSLDNWSRVLGSGTFQQALLHTLAIAATTTVLALACALPAALTIALRLSPRARDLAIAALVVPVFSSYILRIYAWQIVLSPQGIANRLLGVVGIEPLPLLGGAFSLYVGLLTLTLPIAVLILAFALSGVDRTQIEAAGNLGASPSRVLWNVLLPSVRPALVLAASTTFLLAFGDYVGPLFMTGSNPPTLAILVVDTVKSGSQWPRASVIGVTMLVLLGLLFWLGPKLAARRAS